MKNSITVLALALFMPHLAFALAQEKPAASEAQFVEICSAKIKNLDRKYGKNGTEYGPLVEFGRASNAMRAKKGLLEQSANKLGSKGSATNGQAGELEKAKKEYESGIHSLDEKFCKKYNEMFKDANDSILDIYNNPINNCMRRGNPNTKPLAERLLSVVKDSDIMFRTLEPFRIGPVDPICGAFCAETGAGSEACKKFKGFGK